MVAILLLRLDEEVRPAAELFYTGRSIVLLKVVLNVYQ